jgi:V/A-type H+-transporting ATPase subunit C
MRAVYPPYLNARISMLASRLIPLDRLAAWVDQPAGETRTETDLLELGIELDEIGGDSVDIEQALLSRLLEDVLIITRPLTGPERDFLVYGMHWFELANLKVLIRGKFSGRPEAEIRGQLLNIDPFTTLPTEELLHTEDPAEMLRGLEATPYADLARQARRAFEEHKDLFSLELAIDRRFFIDLQKRARAVDQSQRQAVMYLTGCTLDRFNLVWLLRYRFSYNLSPAETFYLLIPSGHRLDTARLEALSQLGSLEEVLDALPERLKETLSGAASITEVENRLEAQARLLLQGFVQDFRHPIARAFAYILLREIELRYVVAIIKGKRLGFAPTLIRFAIAMGE